MKEEVKQVIVIRKDLNMRKGKIAAQAAHASMKVILQQFKRSVRSHPVEGPIGIEYSIKLLTGEPLYEWLEGIFTKVVVSCDSEEELLELKSKADQNNIINALIKDSGKTEFNGIPTYTALSIGPTYVGRIDKITGHLKLL